MKSSKGKIKGKLQFGEIKLNTPKPKKCIKCKKSISKNMTYCERCLKF